MFLVLLFLTLCLHAVDCPGWQPGTGAMTHGGVGSATPSPSFLPDAPRSSGSGDNGGTSPGAPPLGEAQGPDPRTSQRVSIRPQPTRARRCEAMAPGPLWGRGAAQAVARVPTRQRGVGGRAGGTPAAALRLSLPPGVAGVAAGRLPHPPPPPRGTCNLGGSPGATTPCRGTDSHRGRTSSRQRGALAPTY